MNESMSVAKATNGNGNGNGSTVENLDVLKAMLNEFEVESVKLGLIGFSGCGGNAMMRLLEVNDPSQNLLVRPLILETDARNLEARIRLSYAGKAQEETADDSNLYRWVFPKDGQAENRCKFLQLGPLATKGRGAGGNPKLGEAAASEPTTVEKLSGLLTQADINVVITGLGGGSGSGGAPIVAKQSADLGVVTVCIAVKPFACEGIRLKYANEAEKKLIKVVPTFVIYNENIFKFLNDGNGQSSAIGHEEAFNLINAHSIDPQLEMFKHLILSCGLINVDARDFEELCRLGHQMYFGYSKFPNDNSEAADPDQLIEKVFNELISNPFQNPGIVKQAKGYMLLLSGQSWTIQHEQLLKQKLENYFGDSSKVSTMRTWSGIFPSDSPGVAVLLTAGQPAKLVADSIGDIVNLVNVDQVDTVSDADGANVPMFASIPQPNGDLPKVVPPVESETPPQSEVGMPMEMRGHVVTYRDLRLGRTFDVRVTLDTKKAYESLFNQSYLNKSDEQKLELFEHAQEVLDRFKLEIGDKTLLVPPHLRNLNVESIRENLAVRQSLAQPVGAAA